MENMSEVGVIIARFQVHELHPGHINIIEKVLETHKKVIVLLGVSIAKTTFNNPLDYQTRERMIREYNPDILVAPIFDSRSDVDWSEHIDQVIQNLLTPTQTPVLYGGRNSFLPYYSGVYPKKAIDAYQDTILSGTSVRAELSKTITPSKEFRAGVIWATQNQFPKTIATVDIAILDEDNGYPKRILLARKPKERAYRFVGGFTTPRQMSYEEDAVRELAEETTLIRKPEDLIYVCSQTINDWRYASEIDKIRTILFKTRYISNEMIKASDDIIELKWFDLNYGSEKSYLINEFARSILVPEHQNLFINLMKA